MKLVEWHTTILKDTWAKRKDYVKNSFYWQAFINVEYIRELKNPYFVYSGDLELFDCFETLDGTRFIEFRTYKEPKKDFTIIIRPLKEED